MVRKTTTRRRTTAKRSTAKRKAPTRKTAAKKPAAKRKKTTTTRRRLEGVSAQLDVYKNPFSGATSQPKIPDGDVNESLGHQTQAVGELVAANATQGGTAGLSQTGVMHILMYGGQNAGAIVWDDVESVYPNYNTGSTPFSQDLAKLKTLGFNGAVDIRFDGVSTAGGELNTPFGQTPYQRWRLVSQGLRLALLNPAETNDGWWEGCRVNFTKDTDNYVIINKNNSNLDRNSGAIVPRGVLSILRSRQIVNEQSYQTGLLRDIKNKQFMLTPTSTDHTFAEMTDAYDVSNEDVLTSTAIGSQGYGIQFNDGRNNIEHLLDKYVDKNYDMYYIRIHGRASGENTRLHYNLVSNQEITFDNSSRESRYHTATHVEPMQVDKAQKEIRQNHRNFGVPGT